MGRNNDSQRLFRTCYMPGTQFTAICRNYLSSSLHRSLKVGQGTFISIWDKTSTQSSKITSPRSHLSKDLTSMGIIIFKFPVVSSSRFAQCWALGTSVWPYEGSGRNTGLCPGHAGHNCFSAALGLDQTSPRESLAICVVAAFPISCIAIKIRLAFGRKEITLYTVPYNNESY
jgi:hypothetical protein